MKFLRSFLSVSNVRRPTWKKLLLTLTLPLSNLQRPTWGQSHTVGPILYRFLHFRANKLDPSRTAEVGEGQSQGKFFMGGDSRLQAPGSGWRLEVGEGQSQGKFFPGCRADSGGRTVETDKNEHKNFILGTPQNRAI